MSDLAQELEDLGGADITAALDEVPVHTFVLDADAIVRWQNKAAREQIGDRLGRKWASEMTEQSEREAEKVWDQLLSTGEPIEVTIDVILPDGTIERRDVSAAPLRDGGAVVGVFGIGAAVGAIVAGPRGSGGLGLTERQTEVLHLLAQGKSTAQIAEELFLSKTTVRNHIAHLMANLGVHSRVQAVIAAARAGLIRPGKR
jgi:DNA-binding CsgD family transcriptional regulator